MIDVLEALLAQVEEEQGEGETLQLTSLEMPRWQSGGETGQSAGPQPSWSEGQAASSHGTNSVGDSLLAELAQMEHRAQGGQSLDLHYHSHQAEGGGAATGGRGAITLASQVVRQANTAQTAVEMTRGGGRQHGTDVTVQSSGGGTALRTMDRAMERDARRYDGGYLLG